MKGDQGTQEPCESMDPTLRRARTPPILNLRPKHKDTGKQQVGVVGPPARPEEMLFHPQGMSPWPPSPDYLGTAPLLL